MGLKEEIVEIGGRQIKVKELSVINRIQLVSVSESGRNVTTEDTIKLCVSEEDWEFLQTISGQKESEQLIETLNKVNKWGKHKEVKKETPL